MQGMTPWQVRAGQGGKGNGGAGVLPLLRSSCYAVHAALCCAGQGVAGCMFQVKHDDVVHGWLGASPDGLIGGLQVGAWAVIQRIWKSGITAHGGKLNGQTLGRCEKESHAWLFETRIQFIARAPPAGRRGGGAARPAGHARRGAAGRGGPRHIGSQVPLQQGQPRCRSTAGARHLVLHAAGARLWHRCVLLDCGAALLLCGRGGRPQLGG